MADIRKRVRDAMVAILSADETGFNQQLAATLSAYEVEEQTGLSLVWGSDSRNVFQGQLSSDDESVAQLRGQLTLRLWTSLAQWTGDTKGGKWSGRVTAHLDFLVHFSQREAQEDSLETMDTESVPDAVEDAVIEVFSRASINWGSDYRIAYAGEVSCDRPSANLLDAGWEQLIPITIDFRVDVPRS